MIGALKEPEAGAETKELYPVARPAPPGTPWFIRIKARLPAVG